MCLRSARMPVKETSFRTTFPRVFIECSAFASAALPLTLDSAPQSRSPAEMTAASPVRSPRGPHDASWPRVGVAPSRRCSRLNGTRLSSRSRRCTVTLTSASPQRISSLPLSRVPMAKEEALTDSATARKSRWSPVNCSRTAIFTQAAWLATDGWSRIVTIS